MQDAYNESKWMLSGMYQAGRAPYVKQTGISAESCGCVSAPAKFSQALNFAGISVNQTYLEWHIRARKWLRSQELSVFIHIEAILVDCGRLVALWERRCRRPLGPVSHAQHAPALSDGVDTPATATSKSRILSVLFLNGLEIAGSSNHVQP